jgi:hypothetical protein
MPKSHERDGAAMRQVDSILERFPGPVTLTVSWRRRLIALVFCLAVTALFTWLWIVEGPGRDRLLRPDRIMYPLTIGFFGVLAIRAGFLLLFPKTTATLTLDADGFELGHVFHKSRIPWRSIGDFRVETTGVRRIGGRITQVWYDAHDVGADGRGWTRKPRVLPEVYGEPRLRRDELVRLMNAWRARALAQPPPRRHVPLLGAAPDPT